MNNGRPKECESVRPFLTDAELTHVIAFCAKYRRLSGYYHKGDVKMTELERILCEEIPAMVEELRDTRSRNKEVASYHSNPLRFKKA